MKQEVNRMEFSLGKPEVETHSLSLRANDGHRDL